MRALLLLALVPLVADASCYACRHRSSEARKEFIQQHPCPGYNRSGECAYVVDHIQALCVGGKDSPDNMQWQSIHDAYLKDRWECRKDWRSHVPHG